MAYTGDQHTRFLIAGRMTESFCQRYNLPVTIQSANYYLTFTLPERVSLSSSMLSEWSDIIGKYKKFRYSISIVNNQNVVRID